MPFSTMQVAFTGGELSPAMSARVDIEKYKTGAKTLKNFFVHAQGGISNRPGTEFVTEVKDSNKIARVVQFEFNTEDTYALEFGNLYMRVVRNGGQVLEGGVVITAATQANPVVITATSHGYANGDEVYISGVGGMIELNDRKFIVANITANTVELSGEDGTAYTAFTSGGVVSRIFTLVTPYLEADLFDLKFTQSGDIMTIAHPSHVTNDLSRTDHDAWTLDNINPGANVNPPIGVGAVYSGAGTGINYDWVVTSIDPNTGEESVASTAAGVTNKDLSNAGDSTAISWTAVAGVEKYNIYRADDGSGFYGFVGSSTTVTFTDRNIEPEFGDTPSLANKNPFAKFITAITQANPAVLTSVTHGYDTGDVVYLTDIQGMVELNDLSYTITVVSPDTFSLDGIDSTAFTAYTTGGLSYRLGDSPATVTYHEQRRVFAQSDNNPRTTWMSQSSNFKSHNVSDAVRDDDGITATIAGQQINEIRHMVSAGALIAFTSGGEWLVKSSNASKPITPSTIAFVPQSYYGASEVQPLTIGTDIIFIEQDASAVRSLAYSLDIDGYSGSELSVLSTHLLKGRQIVDWAFAKVPFNILWCIMDDGGCIGMTYVKEHQVWAWWTSETAGKFESVCSVPEADENAVYFVIRRKINGVWKRFIERLHSRLFTDIQDAYFVDSGKSLDMPITITGATQANPVVVTAVGHGISNGATVDIVDVEGMIEINGRFKIANVAANTFELQSNDAVTVNVDGTGFEAYDEGGIVREAVTSVVGLDHLNGETVSILANGNALEPQVVVNGAISLGSIPYSRIHAGLPYNADFETLDINAQDPTGSVYGKIRQVKNVMLRVEDTRFGKIGKDFDNLTAIKQRQSEVMGQPINLFTGDNRQILPPGWGSNGRFVYRQDDPTPVTILGVIPEAELGGKGSGS